MKLYMFAIPSASLEGAKVLVEKTLAIAFQERLSDFFGRYYLYCSSPITKGGVEARLTSNHEPTGEPLIESLSVDTILLELSGTVDNDVADRLLSIMGTHIIYEKDGGQTE